MVIGDGGGDMIMVIEANCDDNGDGGEIMMEMTEKYKRNISINFTVPSSLRFF